MYVILQPYTAILLPLFGRGHKAMLRSVGPFVCPIR